MPNVNPCRYCGSSCIFMDVSVPCTLKCSRCGRSVTAPSQRKAAKRWVEDPMKVRGLPWPVLLCGRCQVTPRLRCEKTDGGPMYCFQCPSCKASSMMCATPYDAMLAWRDDMSVAGDD